MSGSGVLPGGPFGAFHHIGIAVPELEQPVARICALLSGEVAETGADDLLAVSWVWIRSEGNPIFELIAPAAEHSPIARHLQKHGPGLHHVSFMPATLDVALNHTRECCLGVLGEDRDHDGFEEFFVHPAATGGALFHAFRELGKSGD